MPALLERPKMSRAMWDALKAHIMRQRQRKKQEQEADEAIERQRIERENKQKQDVMTLEETKEQIIQIDQKLGKLREEKHELFIRLKKVLNEDETRKRKESNDMIGYSQHTYSPAGPVQIGGHPSMFMQSGLIAGRPTMYKIGVQSTQSGVVMQGMKRARSPSPPPAAYQTPYNHKAQAVAAYSTPRFISTHNHGIEPSMQPAWKNARTGEPGQFAGPAGSGAYYSQTLRSSPGNFPQVHSSYPGHVQFQPPPSNQQQNSESGQAASHAYHIQHMQQSGYSPVLHQTLEHSREKSSYPEEKYYNVQQMPTAQLRGASSIHGAQSIIPIQQQAKPGGITAGYPIRGQPNPQSVGNPNYQQPPSSQPQHGVYTSQSSGPRHSFQGRHF